ncbi:Uncharacterised protein [Candidatus Tiddalikarchaeum anstoanum]|nr:Uncharacterised protein [Candidatus Tiddalikarchaeum anstoanum]
MIEKSNLFKGLALDSVLWNKGFSISTTVGDARIVYFCNDKNISVYLETNNDSMRIWNYNSATPTILVDYAIMDYASDCQVDNNSFVYTLSVEELAREVNDLMPLDKLDNIIDTLINYTNNKEFVGYQAEAKNMPFL